MMKSVIAFTLLLFTTHSEVVIENPCQTMLPREEGKNWGEGAFFIPDSFTLSIYKDTKGQKVGNLQWGDNKRELKMSGQDENEYRKFHRYNIEWLGHFTIEILMVKKCENPEYLKILWSKNDSFLYIKSQDLIDQAAQYFTYKEFLFKEDLGLPDSVLHPLWRDWSNIGVNLNMSCLNLRKEPNINSEIIHCVKGNDWPRENGESTHFEILDTKGDWAKVESTTLV